MSSSSSESVQSDVDNENQSQIPVNSRQKYIKAYDNFILWRKERNITSFSEEVLLSYFEEQFNSKKAASTTLWTWYSMLKVTLNINNGIHIEKYPKLNVYLKEVSKGHDKKKVSKVFSRLEVETFLKEAPDNDFLVEKVALIIGIHGACRSNELIRIMVTDIERHPDSLIVKLKNTIHQNRLFAIRGSYKDIVDKYVALRPPKIQTNRLFIRFHEGKCSRQVMGRHTISSIPKQIATFLNLPDPKEYTGHCFRRTSAVYLRSAQVVLPELMRSEQQQKTVTVGEVYKASKSKSQNENVNNIDSDASNSTQIIVEHIKQEVPYSYASEMNIESETVHIEPEVCWGSPAPAAEQSPPQQQECIHELESGRIRITQNINKATDTKTISIPDRNITIIFENCTNVSNIQINL